MVYSQQLQTELIYNLKRIKSRFTVFNLIQYNPKLINL